DFGFGDGAERTVGFRNIMLGGGVLEARAAPELVGGGLRLGQGREGDAPDSAPLRAADAVLVPLVARAYVLVGYVFLLRKLIGGGRNDGQRTLFRLLERALALLEKGAQHLFAGVRDARAVGAGQDDIADRAPLVLVPDHRFGQHVG